LNRLENKGPHDGDDIDYKYRGKNISRSQKGCHTRNAGRIQKKIGEVAMSKDPGNPPGRERRAPEKRMRKIVSRLLDSSGNCNEEGNMKEGGEFSPLQIWTESKLSGGRLGTGPVKSRSHAKRSKGKFREGDNAHRGVTIPNP